MHDLALLALRVAGCLVAVEFAAGIVHWAEDTWLAPGMSPLLDRYIVLPNIGHHRTPGAIRGGSYWSTNGVSITIGALIAVVIALAGVRAWEPYLIVALGAHANQVHMWAHSSNAPRLVQLLQRYGLLQSPAHHAVHHRRPYGVRYCPATNLLNPLLDAVRFWRALEWVAVRLGATVQRATPARGGF